MRLSANEERLMAEMTAMGIIDCHEHLPPEAQRTGVPQDVFTLFSHYTRHDLFSAGMDRDRYHGNDSFSADRPIFQSLFDQDIPLEKRWEIFRPYWDAIKHGSYARAARLTAKMVYQVEDIDDDTYQALSERIFAQNTPGIYRRILNDRCNIRVALTQCGRTDVGAPLVPLMPLANLTTVGSCEQLERRADELSISPPRSLDGYVALVQAQLEQWIEQGTVGLKMMSGHYTTPTRHDAEEAFSAVTGGNGEAAAPQRKCLSDYLTHLVVDLAAERELVVAVHAGIWGDFRRIDSTHMLEFAPRHPDTNFDLYHLGMPSVRDTIVVAKNLPNVFLNLCWTHIISQAQTVSGLDELIDQVPVNKVLAFGGDYARPVEKIVGHLHMAREDYARVFAQRIDRGLMSTEDAVCVLRQWFWVNPLRLYSRLDVTV